MLHRKLSHAIVVGTLAGIWGWLAGLWQGTSSIESTQTGDQGHGIDPNG